MRQKWIVVQIVGLVRDVSYEHVLFQRRNDDPVVQSSYRPIGPENRQNAVLYLLQEIRHSVRLVDTDKQVLLIDGGVVIILAEKLVRCSQHEHLVGLRFDTQIIITCIVPSSTI